MWQRRFYSVWWLLLMAHAADAQLAFHAGHPESRGDPFGLLASPESGLVEAFPVRTRSPEHTRALWLETNRGESAHASSIRQAAMMPLPMQLSQVDLGDVSGASAAEYSGSFSSRPENFDIGWDLYAAPEFKDGLIIVRRNIAMKLGGYVKVDFIYDFDAIDSTDSFITTSIPVGAPDRTNSRAHARQTRLSADTRWKTNGRVVQVFVEGDFFSENDQFRLRHAYGEVGSLLVGRTWTTFTDVTAAPATLDFEGSVSNVNRRQAQARWKQSIVDDVLTIAFAVEDTQFIIIPPPSVSGESRSPSPDVVTRVRMEQDWGKFQAAFLYRVGAFQPTGDRVVTGDAWGLNFTGAVLLVESTKAYYQILFGEGIGSYRGLPDAAPATTTTDEILPLFGWMVGVTHRWNNQFSSNFTYAENSLENAALQDAGDVHETTYLAANLVWSPLERVKMGIEYLYGVRRNVDRSEGDAHRFQTAVAFALP